MCLLSHLTCLQENICMPHISESLVCGARSRAWNLTAGPQVTPKWCLALDEDAACCKPSTSLHRDRPNPSLQIPCLKSEKKVNLKAKSWVSYAPFHKIGSNFMSKVLIWCGGGVGDVFPLGKSLNFTWQRQVFQREKSFGKMCHPYRSRNC